MKYKIGICLLIVLVITSLFLVYKPSLSQLSVIADIINKISIGIAAVLGVILGKSLLIENERRNKVNEYLKRFPHNKFEEEWEIIENKDTPRGTYYLLEKKKKIKYHILNMKTVYDMGWHIYLYKSRLMPEKEFFSYDVGDVIKTWGEAGE